MVMRPGPIKIRCEQCGWKKTERPQSDALKGLPSQCPKCGSDLSYEGGWAFGNYSRLIKRVRALFR